MDKWAHENNVILDFSRPGKPTDNPFVESFNGSFRDECLNTNWFLSLEDAKEKIEQWRDEYNKFSPHSSLDGKTPHEVFETYKQKPNFREAYSPIIKFADRPFILPFDSRATAFLFYLLYPDFHVLFLSLISLI